jgi:hypothetical protein
MRIENLTFKLDDKFKRANVAIQNLVLANKELETAINVQILSHNAGK